MDSKKTRILTIIGLLTLLLVLIGTTYAFFSAETGVTTSQNVSATSNTTDNLSFQISNDISFNVTQVDFSENGNNKSGESTVTATLTPNNKTGAATMNYYMYLNLTENGINYSGTNLSHQPELMVQVFNGNTLVELTELGTQKTVKGVTGYDITGRQGLITLFNNHSIIANNNVSTNETWRVVVTVINLDIDQQDNTNKQIAGEIIVSKEQRIESPRLAVTVPQAANGTTKGYVETLIEPSIVNDEEVYTIYTVGYITDDSIDGTEYTIDIKNMDINLNDYYLELDGTPEVMTTQADYTNYVTMKNAGLPLTSLSNGDTNSAEATATELYNYSLNSTELTINNVSINCNSMKCTATISESFNNISGKSKHSTTNSNNEAINVLYNGIKFNLKKISAPDNIMALANKYNLENPANITLTNGYIYYHDSNLANGANDGSYRYAGADPDNYVCFGSYATPCPARYLYRIIGIIPVDVIVDETTTPVITERQYLYKLIKNDYEDEITLGVYPNNTAVKATTYQGPSGNQPADNVYGIAWTGSGNIQNNTWSRSNLNNNMLNGYILTEYKYYSDRIANVLWKVGGNTRNNIEYATPISTVYNNEIVNPSSANSLDNNTELANKIGLMYITDYSYAAPQSSWSTSLSNYNDSTIVANNWLYKGVREWPLTRISGTNSNTFIITIDGIVTYTTSYNQNNVGVRRSFYLNKNISIDITNHTGTKLDPFRIDTSSNETRTVTFDSNNGSNIVSQTVIYGEYASEPLDPERNGYGFLGWYLNNKLYDFNTPVTSNITLVAKWVSLSGGYLYHHNQYLKNSANDGSFRYAGADPNNYICFGTGDTTCSDNYLYRIIGLIPVDVVVNEQTGTTEKQYLYKLIRNDYETATTLGIARVQDAVKTSSYSGPSGNQPSSTIDGFHWTGTSNNQRNTWSITTINTYGLNYKILDDFGTYSNNIANVMWKVGGNNYNTINNKTPMRIVYDNEIINVISRNSTDGKIELDKKIGLMYISDYGYAVPQNNWTTAVNNFNDSNITANNWLYRGVKEWLITRIADSTFNVFIINTDGNVTYMTSYNQGNIGLRRSLYLTENTVIDMTNHSGTKADPYRIS